MAETEDNKAVIWHMARTRFCREEKLQAELVEHGLECFIPMKYDDLKENKSGEERKLVPAVHNIVFFKHTITYKELYRLRHEINTPFYVPRDKAINRPYCIPHRQMLEMKALCAPNYTGTLYVDIEMAKARIGSRVRVIHGEFKGLEGKLTRYKGRHYVVVTIAQVGVMVHIPKWYCQRVEE